MLDTLSTSRRRFVLALVLAALLATVATTAALVTRAVGDRGATVAQDEPGPVLLVSGYGGSTRSLEPIRRALADSGRDVVVVPPVGGGTGDLNQQAQVLGDQADSVIRSFGAESVDVVGYSAGGVVARLWVRDLGGEETARRVLSIGSPQHGTSVAALAGGLPGRCPKACRQLEPDSDLLRSLNAGDETPNGPRFVSVWTAADEVVVPPDSARLRGGLDFTVQSVCPGRRTTHGELPSDPVVLAALATALGPDAPHAPTDPTCPPR